MPYAVKVPSEETFIAASEEFNGARLYAELADVPLYVNARIIGRGIVGRRESFRLGWIIEDKRLANGKDRFLLPAALLEWVAAKLADTYPDHTTATGLSPDEVAEIKRAQSAKKAKHNSSPKT